MEYAERVLAGSEKQRHEHEIAIDSLTRQLAPFSEAMNSHSEPFILELPNVWHLASDVKAELAEVEGLVPTCLALINALHPTAAVCGTPTQVAGIYNAIDPATGGWKALTPESMAVMRYRLPTGSAPDEYGLGIINYPGDAWGHTGTIEHAHSMVLVQPDGVTWAISVSGETPAMAIWSRP